MKQVISVGQWLYNVVSGNCPLKWPTDIFTTLANFALVYTMMFFESFGSDTVCDKFYVKKSSFKIRRNLSHLLATLKKSTKEW